MGWLRLVGSLELQVSFAKLPYKRDDILQQETYNLKEPTTRSHPIAYSYDMDSWRIDTREMDHSYMPKCAQVNIKARTHEKVDSIGEGRALSCHAVLIMEKK